MELETFVSRISGFDDKSASVQIDYFVYYLLIENKALSVRPNSVEECFEKLHLHPYTNIPQYMKNASKGKAAKFILNKNGYLLVRKRKIEIDSEIRKPIVSKPSSELFPLELLDGTRGYLKNIGTQACLCYDFQLFDACFVMTRKLLETLIIEVFERHQLDSKIKNKDGHFLYLSDLIGKLLNENSWNISRNSQQALPKIKKLADLSAHNRRFVAKKPDIDKIGNQLRVVIEELVHLVDYPNWK